MVSDWVEARNDEFPHITLDWAPCRRHKRSPELPIRVPSVRAGGTPEISRWCNHRNSTPHHPKLPPRPGRAREGPRGLAGNIVEGMRTLLAPLPGRIPNRGWWGGSFPVVPGRSATFTTG